MPHDFTRFLEVTARHDHNAGRLLHAEDWELLHIEPGHLRVKCHVPDTVLNVAGSLFGGFTPTYVDFIAIWAAMTEFQGRFAWLSTMNMRIDYFEPLYPPTFTVDARVRNRRKRDFLVETNFIDTKNRNAAFALTQLRQMGELTDPDAAPRNPTLGQ